LTEEHSPLAIRLESMSPKEIRELILRLTDFAQFLIHEKTGWMKRPVLPKGYDAGSIASEALTRVLDEGHRQWNPDKYPDLLAYLKGVARSILWDLQKAAEKEALVDSEEDELSKVSTREAAVDEKLSADDLKTHLLDRLQNDDEKLVLLAIFDGHEKSADIAENLGLDTTEVYKLKWKIKQRLQGYDGKVGP
jgi:hypothetical protein